MNPTAIFSKSGKGVQEASGKTSQLSRPDRAVLSVIDGRATLAEVASKVGKQFDNEFRGLINKLDKDGFIREVSPGAAVPGSAKPAAPAAKPASKPTAPMEVASDLDFTSAMAATPKKSAPPVPPPQALARAPAPPPKPTAVVPPPPPPPSAAEVAQKAVIAKDQQSAFARAREEAEEKAAKERDRVKSEAEAKVRAETETRLRAEAEQKMKADAEAAAKRAEAEAAAARSAAIRAAAEAKVKAEAEAKRAREEAERAKREAEEKVERARKEAEEKARREQEELKRKLEEERKAREEAERRAKEEAERARRELEEERRKVEAERKRLEEEQRREEDERAARRKREEQEEAERAAQSKLREEQEEKERAEKEEARKREEDEQAFAFLKDVQGTEPAKPAAAPPPPPPKPAPTGDAFADSLLADLDSFTQRDDEERKAKEEATRKEKEEVARKQQEAATRVEREAAEARQREEDERRRKEEEKQRLRDEEEKRVRRVREEQEQAEREAEERRRKLAAAQPVAPGGDDIGITDEDLELDEVKKEAALLEKKKDRKEEREKEREKEKAAKRERDREAKARKEKEREEKETKKATAYRPRRKSHFGRNLFFTLIFLAIVGAGVVHVIPLSTDEYERAATAALGRPVKIGAAHFSAIGGVQYRFDNVSIGDFKVPTVRGYPELGSLLSDRKTFTRIELDGLTLPQNELGDVLFAKGMGDSLGVSQITLKNLKLAGPLPLPPLDGEVQLAGGGLRSATLRGPEGLVAKLGAKEQAIEFDVSTSQFTLPFAQGITLIQFSMKGDATRLGMKISQWDGLIFSGKVAGSANLRWGNTWTVDGVMTARGVNAAVFAPALVSDGRADGSGRFSMTGVEPAKLGSGARLEGNFTVLKGVLGNVDLSRALQTGGRVITGQTQFAEMSGQGVYDRGAVSIRNVNLGAGALNAGASADISETGALSGRIVADVRTTTQNLRSTLLLGGTVQEPQVRN